MKIGKDLFVKRKGKWIKLSKAIRAWRKSLISIPARRVPKTSLQASNAQ